MISLIKAALGGLTGVCRALGHQGPSHNHLKILTAGMKSLEPIPDYSSVHLPNRRKLKFIAKIPIGRAKKQIKNLWDIRGPAPTGTAFTSGQYAIVAMGGGYLHWGHFEMMRLTINRGIDSRTTFARWRVNAPYKPVTKKSLGQRMGGGKGAIDRYVTPVRAGRLILEVGGKVELEEVQSLLTEVAKKLPLRTKVLSREELAALQQKQADMEKNNQNPWTFKEVAQSNMLGIRKVISPFDLRNNGRYAGKFYFPNRV